MARPALVLVHSFGTNSVLLAGLRQFLERYFTVYLIDLPGFSAIAPPLKSVSFEGFSGAVQQKIDDLGLIDYFLGGISFGFYVVNSLPYSHRCRGIIAMEPYVGASSLRISSLKRWLIQWGLAFVSMLHLEVLVWHSSFVKRTITRFHSASTAECLLRHYDPRTVTETARLILQNDRPAILHPTPYFLVVNPQDSTVDVPYLIDYFQTQAQQVTVITTAVDHYPKDMSEQYFASHINEREISKVTNQLGRQTELVARSV